MVKRWHYLTGIFLFRLDSYPDHHLLPLFIHSLILGPSFINRKFLEGLFLDALASRKTILDIKGRFHEKMAVLLDFVQMRGGEDPANFFCPLFTTCILGQFGDGKEGGWGGTPAQLLRTHHEKDMKNALLRPLKKDEMCFEYQRIKFQC